MRLMIVWDMSWRGELPGGLEGLVGRSAWWMGVILVGKR